MRVSKEKLCEACLKLKSPNVSVEEFLGSEGYKLCTYKTINKRILQILKDEGGCTNCKALIKNSIIDCIASEQSS